ncbi:thioredoxin-like family protein [Blastocystis sp. ATCC 50177/Nand II]|uniref:Thioredoxin-like family protein n=1 Tax=Blastocystis sp. subtype 1 (strain ATCC 50177 / NandII) TaxID=478820 RepID=A0A196S8E9_BLAHN|nr:thioredoxin-like family protein [Blastocystis sp. ATCC 50177/Nand II]
MITLDVYFDFACPWCYVGFLRFLSALKTYEKEIHLRYHTYMIDTGTDMHGELLEDYCDRRWGSSAWISELKKSGEKDCALFANWRYWPNTFNAHRLLLYAEQQQFPHMLQLINSLFLALYEKGENISAIPTLVRLAQDVGLSGCDEMLHSTAFTAEVVEEDDFAKHDLEIDGVPYFIVNDRFYLEGANPSSAFTNVFNVVERLEEEEKKTA